MKAKRKFCLKHFKRRCQERVGEVLDYKLIAKKIQQQKLRLIRRSNSHITLWEYEHENKKYVVVYSTSQHCVVTIWEKLSKVKKVNLENENGSE